VSKQQIKVGSVLAKTSTVVIESEDCSGRICGTCISAENTGTGLAVEVISKSLASFHSESLLDVVA
jgi:hypothetical protein